MLLACVDLVIFNLSLFFVFLRSDIYCWRKGSNILNRTFLKSWLPSTWCPRVLSYALFADSNSFVDDTDVEFRSRVEQIREIGGDSWLKIFDEIQGEEEMTQV